MQGMCDLAAPLMVLFDDECMAYSCFSRLMDTMCERFLNSSEMDSYFHKMLCYIGIIDADLYAYMSRLEEQNRFYFCYRWFLLDFKRELAYHDIYAVWETIWSSRRVYTKHLSFFVALAIIISYESIIIENKMDYTDMIRFFNEMAEKHEMSGIVKLARHLVDKLRHLLDDAH